MLRDEHGPAEGPVRAAPADPGTADAASEPLVFETDLEAGSVDAALGWTHSADTLHESLTQLGNQFASPDRA